MHHLASMVYAAVIALAITTSATAAEQNASAPVAGFASPTQSAGATGSNTGRTDHSTAPPGASEPTAPVWLPLVVGALALLISLKFVSGGLKQPTSTEQKWSLADATSEESTVTVDGKQTTVMTASTSRLIALYGMLAILVVFLATAAVVLWDLAATGKTPSGLDKVMNFMLGGVSLFAPYAANQVRAAFDSIGKKS